MQIAKTGDRGAVGSPMAPTMIAFGMVMRWMRA
jgi:hypothetical protein